jgi:hypothetical protein
MKKIIFTLAIMLVAGSAFAQSASGTSFIGFNADLGIALPSGTVSTGYTADTATAYGASVKYGYGLTDTGMIIAGLGYEYRPMALKYSAAGSTGTLLFKQSYVVIDLAWRFLYDSFYADLGAFYGIKVGKGKYAGTGDIESGNLSDLSGSKEKNPFGLIFGIGYLLKVGEKVQIDIGAKFKPDVTNQYEDNSGWKLKSSNLSLTLGANYSL